MLKGKTSFKTKIVLLASNLYDFGGLSHPLIRIEISDSTDNAMLFGSQEPHNSESYINYLSIFLGYLEGSSKDNQQKSILERL